MLSECARTFFTVESHVRDSALLEDRLNEGVVLGIRASPRVVCVPALPYAFYGPAAQVKVSAVSTMLLLDGGLVLEDQRFGASGPVQADVAGTLCLPAVCLGADEIGALSP